MAFRKRNAAVTSRSQLSNAERATGPSSIPSESSKPASLPGTRPSLVDGRPVTSTGTYSLDNLLAGHSGFPLGNSILIEESASTDYAGTLLRYFAAEGVVQQQHVHVVGLGPSWGKELPGLIGAAGDSEEEKPSSKIGQERMKIAWRYQKLGEFGVESSRVPKRRDGSVKSVPGSDAGTPEAFCHSFDLTKRLALPSATAINYISIPQASGTSSPFVPILANLEQQLVASPASIHRVIVPSILSPAFYPPEACMPEHILQFLQAVHSLLRRNSNRMCVMFSLPTALYPRATGLTRWMELLSDGVLELIPFPHTVDFGPPTSGFGADAAQEEKPQGMFKVHRLPIVYERGGGTSHAGFGDDLAFTVTRRRFQIKPFSLPPIESGGSEAQQGQGGESAKADLEF